MARKTKLTPALQAAIANAVTGGVPFSQACLLVGISDVTGRQWLARGRGEHERPATPAYVLFVAAITHAEAQDEARRVLRINQAGQGGATVYERIVKKPDVITTDRHGTVTERRGETTTERRYAPPDWQADAWHLERKTSERWGRKDRVDLQLTIERAAKQIAEELGMTPEEILAEAEAYLREAAHAGR